MYKIKNLEDIFPIWKIEGDYILDKQGCITVGYALQLPEIFTLSTHDYETMHATWVRAIKILPVGTIVHKQDWFIQSRFSIKVEDEKTLLQNIYQNQYKVFLLLQQYCLLFHN